MSPSAYINFPQESERKCLKCGIIKDVLQHFTNGGRTWRTAVCDLCLKLWREDQLAKGHTGATSCKDRKKSLGKNNP